MTALEEGIEKLREELHGYHVEVTAHITRCESCREDVAKMSADLYGLPGKKEESPGLLGDVAEFRRGRRMILIALRGAWAVLLLVLGTIATAVFGGK